MAAASCNNEGFARHAVRGRTPHDGSQHSTADEDSLWSRITSVSRRSLARIYGFLTGSRMSGSTTEAARVPSQGTLNTDSRQFSPPPPPGGGGCAGPPPSSEPPQGGWNRLLPLLAAGVSPYPPCACYFSNTLPKKISNYMHIVCKLFGGHR